MKVRRGRLPWGLLIGWTLCAGPTFVTAGPTIQYIRPDAPRYDMPPLKGVYYEKNVPDTIDLAERARIGLEGIQ